MQEIAAERGAWALITTPETFHLATIPAAKEKSWQITQAGTTDYSDATDEQPIVAPDLQH